MNPWHTSPLEDLVREKQISYGVVQPGQDTPQGVPIVRVRDVRNGIVSTSNPMRVDQEIAARHRRTTLDGGELLLSLVGTVGESAVAPLSIKGWNVARAIAVLRPEGVSSRWLQLCFESPSVQAIVDSLLNTTVQATLNLSDLKQIPIPVPPPAVREGIEQVIGALDDKITANTKLIATVDSLAQAQFHTALHDSQPQPLSSLASFVNGKAFTKGASGTGRVVVRIAELNSGIGKSTVFSDAEVDDKHVAHPGDILFAWSGSLTLHRWFRDEAIVNQHIFKVIPNEGIADWLIYELLRNKMEDFKMIAADKATTMGHIQRKHLDEPVLAPSEVKQGEISPLMESLWQTALTTERENLTLAATRDALLPQLMSGRLQVKNAEKVLESAL